jgi:hypothetical protein
VVSQKHAGVAAVQASEQDQEMGGELVHVHSVWDRELSMDSDGNVREQLSCATPSCDKVIVKWHTLNEKEA